MCKHNKVEKKNTNKKQFKKNNLLQVQNCSQLSKPLSVHSNTLSSQSSKNWPLQCFSINFDS